VLDTTVPIPAHAPKHVIGRAGPGNMKIKDIIVEADFRKSVKQAIPHLSDFAELDNGNVPYLQYRFGLLLDGSPDIKIDPIGAVEGHLFTVGYSDADNEIIDAAAKMMGIHRGKRNTGGSKESENVYKTSPVKARDPVALKSKKK
jgi:hypothetical protein